MDSFDFTDYSDDDVQALMSQCATELTTRGFYAVNITVVQDAPTGDPDA